MFVTCARYAMMCVVYTHVYTQYIEHIQHVQNNPIVDIYTHTHHVRKHALDIRSMYAVYTHVYTQYMQVYQACCRTPIMHIHTHTPYTYVRKHAPDMR